MAELLAITQDAREAALKLMEKESWSSSRENAFLNGVVEVYQSMASAGQEEHDERLARALVLYLQKSPTRKRTLVTLLDRIRQRDSLPLDEVACAGLLKKIRDRLTDATTDPTSLLDRFRRFLARV